MSIFAILVIWGIISLPLGVVIGKLIETPDDEEEEYERW
jgi:hypothetical protein